MGNESGIINSAVKGCGIFDNKAVQTAIVAGKSTEPVHGSMHE
jgi:hypothetical protein